LEIYGPPGAVTFMAKLSIYLTETTSISPLLTVKGGRQPVRNPTVTPVLTPVLYFKSFETADCPTQSRS
jgi:hypothetical protein